MLCAAYLDSDTSYTCKHGRTCTRAQLAARVQSTARVPHWLCANVDSFSHMAHSPTSSVHSDEVSCLIDRGSCPRWWREPLARDSQANALQAGLQLKTHTRRPFHILVPCMCCARTNFILEYSKRNNTVYVHKIPNNHSVIVPSTSIDLSNHKVCYRG